MTVSPPPPNSPYEVRVVETPLGTRFAPFINGQAVMPPRPTIRDGVTNENLDTLLDLLDYGAGLGYDVEAALSTPSSSPGATSAPLTPSYSWTSSDDEGGSLEEFEEFIYAETGVFCNGRPMQPGVWYTATSSSPRPPDPNVTVVLSTPSPPTPAPPPTSPEVFERRQRVRRRLAY